MKISSLLYIGHSLSSWGDRMWQFAVPLLLLDLDTSKLTLAAAYGLVTSATVLIFGPVVGDWIDRTERLKAIRISLLTQNSFVVMTSLLLFLNRLFKLALAPYQKLVKFLALALGSVSYLASSSCGIIVQRDWVVVICHDDNNALAALNATLRRINLISKLVSPLFCGELMSALSLTWGAAFIAVWNFCSMFVEYYLLKTVYYRVPELSKKQLKSQDEAKLLSDSTENDNEILEDQYAKEKSHSYFETVKISILSLKSSWKLFFSQSVALPCFGFSFLYLTVLGFGYITIAYAYHQCFNELMMGLLTTATAITGIVATYIFPILRQKIGLVKTGLFFAAAQTSTLLLCISSVFLKGSPFYDHQTEYYSNSTTINESSPQTNLSANDYESSLFITCLDGVSPPSSFLSLSVLMSGIILARIGLWGFDLTITQLVQENVENDDRGAFSGVQNSLNNLCDILIFLLVMIFPRIEQFGILVIISSVMVSGCYVMYTVYALREIDNICCTGNLYAKLPDNHVMY